MTSSACFGLCAHQHPKRWYWSPGNSPYQSWGWEGYLGRQTSYPSNDKPDSRKSDVKFGNGDIVGCGLDMTSQSLFFTKNGKLLSQTKGNYLFTYYFFTEVSGRLYPVVQPFSGTTIVANFGNDKEMPFAWLPGNDRDGGASHVAQEEEGLNKTLHLRATAAL
jgi:hypothetical protein